MLYLDRNENFYGPAPECLNVLKNAVPDLISTYSRDFTLGIKSKLSAYIASLHSISEKQILLSYGSEDMLKQIVHCYLGINEVLMIPQYSWWYYKAVANEVYGRVIEYPLHIHNNTFVYDIDEILSVIEKEQPKIVLFASPNNPTGNSLSERQLENVLERFPKLWVIIDEAYSGFTEKHFNTVPSLVQKYPNLAVLRTFSKLYGLAGLRIGYTFVGKYYQQLTTYSERYLGYNQLSEQSALAALKAEAYYRSISMVMYSERQRYYDLFKISDGYTAFRSDANFILVQIPSNESDALKKHMNTSEIAIKFFTEPGLQDFVRITIGTPAQNSLVLNALVSFMSSNVGISSLNLTK
jgi:histidinol-phosphate aminotransferase